ncbi:unnamed protein product [Adineta steineri]|uniref:Uncharacterized protein n=1 Tax=Adineta steineri TaxID=433720 RepID=A0A815SVR5_9BILA|nr:unnamed protein product [Adineta steineri]
MERILLATVYPNLTELKIINFQQEIVSNHFTNKSSARFIFQQQIINLTLINNDTRNFDDSSKTYTINVYAHILNFFKNLKSLSIVQPYWKSYPGLSLVDLPSNTFFSPILTHLSISVNTFDDCLYLLDGRLKQLIMLSVIVYVIDNSSATVHNMDNLPNLKCFSLKSFLRFKQYDKIVSLLHRMPFLEKLSLYLRVKGRNRVIDGTYIQHDILDYIPQLHSFTFYISTFINTIDLFYKLSNEDIQQTITNIGQHDVASMVNYITNNKPEGSIFSLPFTFDYLEGLGNAFPNIIFSYVTFLLVQDIGGFKHEFFIRLARSFPLLKCLHIMNVQSQLSYDLNDLNTFLTDNTQSYSLIEYPHLTSLDLRYANECYLEQFLNETKAYVPCLMELGAVAFLLEKVTNNFTREDTRRNCTKVEKLYLLGSLKHSKDVCHYLPSLKFFL